MRSTIGVATCYMWNKVQDFNAQIFRHKHTSKYNKFLSEQSEQSYILTSVVNTKKVPLPYEPSTRTCPDFFPDLSLTVFQSHNFTSFTDFFPPAEVATSEYAVVTSEIKSATKLNADIAPRSLWLQKLKITGCGHTQKTVAKTVLRRQAID